MRLVAWLETRLPTRFKTSMKSFRVSAVFARSRDWKGHRSYGLNEKRKRCDQAELLSSNSLSSHIVLVDWTQRDETDERGAPLLNVCS